MIFAEKTHSGEKYLFAGFEKGRDLPRKLPGDKKPCLFLIPEKAEKDNTIVYIYPVKKGISLKELFSKRKMSKDFYVYMMLYCLDAMDEAKSLGINPDGLMFDEEKIYFDTSENRLILLYSPAYCDNSGRRGFKNFLYGIYSDGRVDMSDEGFANEINDLFSGQTLALIDIYKLAYSIMNNIKKGDFGIKGNSDSIYEETDISYDKEKQELTDISEDKVQFRLVIPENFNRGLRLSVKILMYLQDDYDRADREAQYVADRIKQHLSDTIIAEKGEKLRITLSSPDIEIQDTERNKTIMWNGEIAQCQFYIKIPKDYEDDSVMLTARVFRDLACLCELSAVAEIDEKREKRLLEMRKEAVTAFISYSHLDEDAVYPRIHGMQKANKKMDIFFDTQNLVSGEIWSKRLEEEIKNRDIFYLFWSPNARDSEVVAKEIECALKYNGINSIEPVPLVKTKYCPPPPELAEIHFNDAILNYIDDQRYEEE